MGQVHQIATSKRRRMGAMSEMYCATCKENQSFDKCGDILGNPDGVEGVDWYACPDLVCEICGEDA